MKWWQVALLLAVLAVGTSGIVLMDLGNFTDRDLCNGWFCIGAMKAFHAGLYIALAAMWGLGTLLLWVWSNE